jgi:hypothetical protein
MKRITAYSLRARIILLGLILMAPLVLLFIVRFKSNAGQGDLAILTVVVLAGIGAAVLAARPLILHPLQKLDDATAALGEMAALLQQRERELAISESRSRMLAGAMEAMQDGVAV